MEAVVIPQSNPNSTTGHNSSEYVLKANGLETKPFSSYEEALSFGKSWIGKFSIFMEISIYKNGSFFGMISL